MRHGATKVSAARASTVFVLAVVGFGSKAGLVPLHVWLPRAHPEAPSHVSALMSGAMVNLGVYGVVRVGIDLLGGGPRWWGLLVLALGIASALFGILHALVATDLKVLLAYSTTENMGLIFVGVGAALLLAAVHEPLLAGVALAAALLWVLQPRDVQGAAVPGARARSCDRPGHGILTGSVGSCDGCRLRRDCSLWVRWRSRGCRR